jgi:hypothetical protein
VFKAFWAARNPQDATKLIPEIVKSGVSVADAVKRLKAGPAYSAAVAKGVVRSSYTAHGKEFFYSVDVPASYDPERRYPVRFQLHGGVMARSTNQPRQVFHLLGNRTAEVGRWTRHGDREFVK